MTNDTQALLERLDRMEALAKANKDLARMVTKQRDEMLTALAAAERERDASAQFGARIFDQLFEQFCDGAYEVELQDLIVVDAVKCGLVEKVVFDPDQHTDNIGDSEAGDDWFQLTEAGRLARRTAQVRHDKAARASLPPQAMKE